MVIQVLSIEARTNDCSPVIESPFPAWRSSHSTLMFLFHVDGDPYSEY